MNKTELWGRVLEDVAEKVTSATMKSFIKPASLREINDNPPIAYIETPKDMITNVLKRRYLDILSESFKSVTGKEYKIVIKNASEYAEKPQIIEDNPDFVKPLVIPNFIQEGLNALSIAQYALLLLASYFLYTAGCIIIGTVTPTAKDASSFSSIFIIMVILPIFFLGSFTGKDNQAMMYFLTYFPPSAPIAIMLRAIMGSLAEWEFWVGLVDITISGALLAKLATYIFCRNAIEFTAKINFKKLLGSPRKLWKN